MSPIMILLIALLVLVIAYVLLTGKKITVNELTQFVILLAIIIVVVLIIINFT